MTDPRRRQDSFEARFKELERRLADLERSDRMPFTSQTGGHFVLNDESGEPRFAIGEIVYAQSGAVFSKFGTAVYNADGRPSLVLSDEGFEAPYLAMPVAKTNTAETFSNTSWETRKIGIVEFVGCPAVKVRAGLAADAGVTLEARVEYFGKTSAVQTLAGGTTDVLEWTMTKPDGLAVGTGPVYLTLQTRVSGGAGNYHVYDDTFMHQVSGEFATETGI